MIHFLLGVGASLVAAYLLLLVSFGTKAATSLAATLRTQLAVTRRLRHAGVSHIFLERSQYTQTADHGTIHSYMLTARREITYVGLWLAHGVEMANVSRTIDALLSKHVNVELVFLDPVVNFLPELSRALAVSERFIERRIVDAIGEMQQFASQLPQWKQDLFTLRLHRELTTASAFLIDFREPDGRVLVDIKLHGLGRDSSIGIEARRLSTEDSLYDRLVRSFTYIRDSAKEMM